MSDLIDRKAAITAIAKFMPYAIPDESTELYKHGLINLICQLPTVDAVEVVRCKDCKYRYVDGDNVRVNFCELNHNKVQGDDWFCADGERREEE